MEGKLGPTMFQSDYLNRKERPSMGAASLCHPNREV